MVYLNRYSSLIRILLASIIVLLHFGFWSFNHNNLIFSSMIESLFDLIVICVINYSIFISNKPADKSHPYGHWKIENITSLILCFIFFITSFDICKNNITMLMHHVPSTIMPTYDFILIISLIIPTILLIVLEHYNSKISGSILSKFNLVHYATDFFKIILISVSFIISRFVYIWWMDYVLSIILVLSIIMSLVPNFIENINALTDHEADENVISDINKITNGYLIDNLKTRKSGSKIVINFDLLLSKNSTIEEANSIRMALETNINNSIPNSIVYINVK